jgi:hypothetical protein
VKGVCCEAPYSFFASESRVTLCVSSSHSIDFFFLCEQKCTRVVKYPPLRKQSGKDAASDASGAFTTASQSEKKFPNPTLSEWSRLNLESQTLRFDRCAPLTPQPDTSIGRQLVTAAR